MHLGIHLRVRDGRFADPVIDQIRRITRGHTAEVWLEYRDAPLGVQAEYNRVLRRHHSRGEPRKVPIEWYEVWDHADMRVEGDAVISFPDDLFFTKALIAEVRAHLRDMSHDQYQVRQLFCWNDLHTHNEAMPETYSTILMSNSTKWPKILRLENPALDVSFLTPDDRLFKSMVYPEVSEMLSSPEELVEVTCGSTTTEPDRA